METATICLSCMAEKGSERICPHCGYAEGTPPDSPMQLIPGTILNEKYLVGRVLGHGGFGITYLGLDLTQQIKLAIKEFFPSGLVTRDVTSMTVSVYTGDKRASFDYGLEKFLDEGRTLARFNNVPEIVSIHNFFKENGTAYLVMSYVEGITLKEYLAKQGGRLPLAAVLTFMLPVVEALEKVHAMGILHRDISPDNIFVTADYNVRLLDFGAARYAMGEQSRSLSILLKPGYSPEEQYRSHGKQGPWTDVYATAATMYKLLTGQTPPEAMDRVANDDIKPFSALGVIIPAETEAAFMKALSVRAKDRFQTMAEFEKALTKSIEISQADSPGLKNGNDPYRKLPLAESEAAQRAERQKPEYHQNQDSNSRTADSGKAKTVVIAVLAALTFILFITTISFAVVYQHEFVLYNAVSNKEESENDMISSQAELYETARADAASERELLNRIITKIPVIISNIQITNEDNSGTIISTPADRTFESGSLKYATVSFNTDILNGAKTADIYIKIVSPEGIVESCSDSPSGYTMHTTKNSIGWGSDAGGSYSAGIYRVELWYDSKLVGETTFTVE